MSPIEEFIKLVDDEKFEDAHEVLEADWLRFKKEGLKQKALFYKGLINGATAIALIIRGRSERARTITWNAFLKHKDLIDIIENDRQIYYKNAIELIQNKHLKYSQSL